MGWRRVVVVFVGLSGACASAQTSPWPVDQAPQTGAQPSGPSGTQQTLCTLEITRLNQNVEALRTAARTASERKAKRMEMCQYLNELAVAATQLTRYALENRSTCNLSGDAILRSRTSANRRSAPVGRSAYSSRRPGVSTMSPRCSRPRSASPNPAAAIGSLAIAEIGGYA